MLLTEFLNSYTSEVREREIHSSMTRCRKNMSVEVREVEFKNLRAWSFNTEGDLVHESGKFFRICAGQVLDISTGQERKQPVIDQPEQGILGVISRCKNNKIEILLQAKIEPGNLDKVQYSPTVQATKSNYTGVHKGQPVPYLESFLPLAPEIVSEGFQSEHGYKFYRKANNNMHAHNDCVEALDERFMWLSLGDIRYLLSKEHCVNMDTRSVLATIDFVGKSLNKKDMKAFEDRLTTLEREMLFSSVSEQDAIHTIREIYEWIRLYKKNTTIIKQTLPLPVLFKEGWALTDKSLSSQNNRNFELIGVTAQIASRETSSWDQPIVRDKIPKTYVFLLKKINNILHVLAQAVEEDFSWSGAEIGPTIHSANALAFKLGEVLRPFGLEEESVEIIYDKYQSEEGGRFMEQRNRYILAVIDENIPLRPPKDFRWLTLYQIKQLTKYECCVNIEARTLTTIASYYKGI